MTSKKWLLSASHSIRSKATTGDTSVVASNSLEISNTSSPTVTDALQRKCLQIVLSALHLGSTGNTDNLG